MAIQYHKICIDCLKSLGPHNLSGLCLSCSHKRNPNRYWLGKKRSMEDRLRMSIGAKKRDRPIKIKQPQPPKIRKPPLSGANHYNWQGGITTYERKLFLNRRRRNLKLGSGGSHTEVQWNEVKCFYSYMCLCCKKQEPFIRLTRDHILPLAMGGSDDISNIQPLCQSCNSRKQKKEVDFRVNFIPTSSP